MTAVAEVDLNGVLWAESPAPPPQQKVRRPGPLEQRVGDAGRSPPGVPGRARSDPDIIVASHGTSAMDPNDRSGAITISGPSVDEPGQGHRSLSNAHRSRSRGT